MGLEVVFVCVFLCMLPLYSGSKECVNIQLRVPTSSINGYSQNTQFNPGVPYALARNGKNICKSCKGSICYNNCNAGGQIRIQPPQKALTVSVPSDKSPNGRLTITIDTRRQPPADNGETSKQTVDVIVKLVPKDKTDKNQSTFTSGQSSAQKNNNGVKLAANTNSTIDIPGTDQALFVIVNVNDDNSGPISSDTSLTSDITANNGNGEVSNTHTEAAVDGPAPSDGSDSPVTGTKPDQPTPVPEDAPNPGEKPNASTGTVPEAAADDKTAEAGSASGATADSG